MGRLIASMNITLDGFCDHTAVIADEELHEKSNELLKSIGGIIFGRNTYQLMEEGWPPILKNPTGLKSLDEFAALIDEIPKIVFSKSLEQVEWNNTKLIKGPVQEEIPKLKRQAGKDLGVGSPGLIASLAPTGLIDEYRLCVHPVVLGSGRVLFKDISERINLKLVKTDTFRSGAVMLHYQPA